MLYVPVRREEITSLEKRYLFSNSFVNHGMSTVATNWLMGRGLHRFYVAFKQNTVTAISGMLRVPMLVLGRHASMFMHVCTGVVTI